MTMDASTVGWRSEPTAYRFGWQELVLYALGIGAQTSELDYLYEGRGPKSYPTFAVVPAISHAFACMKQAGIDLSSVVHGAQSVRVLGELPPQGTLETHGEIVAFYDLKKFAQMVLRTHSRLEDGPAVYETEWTIIVRDAGGLGGKPPPKQREGKTPERAPDFRVEQKTLQEQALLYRLSGDTNPLHADPETAAKVGFDRGPILHGLATLGFSARALVKAACGGDASHLMFLRGQFRRPVWPGETLATEGWRVDDRVVFQTRVMERDEIVIGNAWAEITG